MQKVEIIFVVGNSRSGTTMMGRILGLHKEVFTFHELHFFEQLWSLSDINNILTSEDAAILYARLLRNQRAGLFAKSTYHQYLEESRKILNPASTYTRENIFKMFLKNEATLYNKPIACEQTPRNLLYIHEILNLYPNSKIIAMVRDPRDVLLSQKGKWRRKFLGAGDIPLKESIRAWVNYHSITISRLWKINYAIIQKFANHPSVMIIRFEDLLSQPEVKLRETCAFLNIDYNPNLLAVPQVGSSNEEDKKEVGILPTAAGNWNKGGLTKSEIYYCQVICKKEMMKANYPISPVKPQFINLFLEAMSFPLKLIFAFTMNINRMKNIRESLLRRLNFK